MQKLQDSVFSIVKTTSLSPAVFSFLQPTEDNSDRTPLGKILNDTKRAWLALGSKFCVIDLKTGLKIAARNFGAVFGHSQLSVTSVVELPTPLTNNSQQLVVSLQSDDGTGLICVFHVNGSQILRCIQTEVVITEMAVSDGLPDGVFTCFDGVVMAGTKNGEILVFDLNRAGLIQALKDISQGYEHLVQGEQNPANLTFLPLSSLHRIEQQRDLAVENDHHLSVLLNEDSLVDGQYLFRNPDGSVRLKAKRDQIRVTVLQYIPQLASLAIGYNFGAFQIWNMLNTELEFTSQVNVECLPVTHFGFLEPCDDPRAFCYLWVVFSVLDRFEEEEFPLAVMYSLTYQGKRMLSDTKCLYQDFSMATLRFQLDLGSMEDAVPAIGGKCVSCHTYSVNSTLGAEGEDSMLNICQLVWECWGENDITTTQYGMLLFDLDQWYKDQMPATCRLESSPFMSATSLPLAGGAALDVRLDAHVSPYSHSTRLEEHFYPNSLQYECISLSTMESCILHTPGIQRQIIASLEAGGPTALLHPTRLYRAARAAGLTPLLADAYAQEPTLEEQRRFLLSLCLEARLIRLLRLCASSWAAPTHASAGCTLALLVDWSWARALELKENANELTAPLFTSPALPDRNVVRTLEHCVQQLTQLTGLLDSILTKCCNLIVPDALSEMEEKYKGIGTVSLYFQVVQWFLRVGLLPERCDAYVALPYPAMQLYTVYNKRRLKLQRLQENTPDDKVNKPCSLLYIDQLIENEFGGERIREMWLRSGSESGGLYPPPSLYSLLRLYLLPDIAEEHKHSLVLYLLVDYSMIYDEVRYEAVIRRLMQFPTMFGLSNTAIKATQAFWHLDHRDFDFALDQLQCLTGNTLSEWQHNVVLSSLLAQKKMQAALQYLHVRKPAAIQTLMRDKADGDTSLACSAGELDDWQSCCNLYLARELIFEALDVIRMCVHNSPSREEKEQVLNYFYKGCKNTGQLSKILQVSLLSFEEEVFIKYLQDCNEPQTSDILIMYYLQQARYLEAEQYNNKLKQNKPKTKDMRTSVESIVDMLDREGARDTLVDVVCSSLPAITNTVAHCALTERTIDYNVTKPKPMSVFLKARSPKNTFTYKSSFIQDTIQNASETWVNRPKMRRGIKRALNIEETPFICTPKMSRNRSALADQFVECTPSKVRKTESTPRTPRVSGVLSAQLERLLAVPELHSTPDKLYARDEAGTPHSILKIRRDGMDAPSPTDSRYLGDSDEELETASNHTHYSDSKHLRFTIPTASESGSTPSPTTATSTLQDNLQKEREIDVTEREKEMDVTYDDFTTSETHSMNESHKLESPPKKLASENKVLTRKSYKDTVRARRSLSISANSSLSDDPNTSIESIADIPITLINPRYSGERRRPTPEPMDSTETQHKEGIEVKETDIEVPKTPKGRRAIRSRNVSPVVTRSRGGTPERLDSPVTPLRLTRSTRSKSRTPERSPRSSPLPAIPELPKQEDDTEPHKQKTLLSMPRHRRSRSRTPEKMNTKEAPRLEAITESPTKSSSAESASSSPRRRLRSRSRTPEVEIQPEPVRPSSPRSLRSRAKTPEKIISPRQEHSIKNKKSLSRLVLEANTFAKLNADTEEPAQTEEKPDNAIECTPMKTPKHTPSLLDVTLSPIVNKSVLQSSNDSFSDIEKEKSDKTVDLGLKTLPAFTTINESYMEKSVLRSYQSSLGEPSDTDIKEIEVTSEVSMSELKPLPAFTTLYDIEFGKSVLNSFESSIDETAENLDEPKTTEAMPSVSLIEAEFNKPVLESSMETSQEPKASNINESLSKTNWKEASSLMTSDDDEMKEGKSDAIIQKEKERIVEIEREINEIEGDMSDGDETISSGDGDIIEAEESEDNENDDDREPSEEESESGGEEEIISIKDTSESSDSSASEDKPQIQEESSNDSNKESSNDSNKELSNDCNKESSNDSNKESSNDSNKELSNDSNKELSNDSIKELSNDSNKESSNDSNKESKQPEETIINVNKGDTEKMEVVVEVNDPLNRASLLTDDNSIISEHSDINLNYSDEKDEGTAKVDGNEQQTKVELDTDIQPVTEIVAETVVSNEGTSKQTEVVADTVDTTDSETPFKQSVAQDIEPVVHEPKTRLPIEVEVQKTDVPIVQPVPIETVESKEAQVPMELVEGDENDYIPIVIVMSKEQEEEVNPISTIVGDQKQEISDPKAVEETMSSEGNQTEANKPISRKRTQSSRNDRIDEEPKTPSRRNRAQSSTSNKSIEIELKTPEKDETPSRRRGKTPTSTEVRRIMTRRASREMSETLDESKELDDSLLSTPKRRSVRSRSKLEKDDDNESVISEASVRSIKSKASEDAGDVKPAAIRKGRKSVLATKTDLSVIPETTAEEVDVKGTEDIIKEYSTSRRLTRHQKAVLESLLEPPATPSPTSKPRSRRTSALSAQSRDDDDASSTHSSIFDVQPIDRISLLNRTDFEGSPDRDEYSILDSPGSDAVKDRTQRVARAASESRALPKAAKITRRVSVDIAATPEFGSPNLSGAASPLRSRRASFNRACEALHTPKGRRTSTDVRKGEADSPHSNAGSEAEAVTPARRTRRASTLSNTSQAKSETGRRSKKP